MRRCNPGFVSTNCSISCGYPAKMKIGPSASCIWFMISSTARSPKSLPPLFVNMYASSTNSTPPRARSITALVFFSVLPTALPISSERLTSKKGSPVLVPLSTPISTSSRATRRATLVFPVPGFPWKTMCSDSWSDRADTPARRNFLSYSSLLRSLRIRSFTGSSPIIWSSSRSRSKTAGALGMRAMRRAPTNPRAMSATTNMQARESSCSHSNQSRYRSSTVTVDIRQACASLASTARMTAHSPPTAHRATKLRVMFLSIKVKNIYSLTLVLLLEAPLEETRRRRESDCYEDHTER
mmetsp:Transcript_8689/g.27326  ORF Transcript_8689/g.27326 Transcript_8689/m.27326 type:complete len:297 (+) Transcript_8689:469-1359(+)